MKEILKKLIEHEELTKSDFEKALQVAVEKKEPLQIAAFLTLLEAKKVTAEELFWVVKFLQPKSIPVKSKHVLIDIVGTGGDHANTFNISTGSAILSAACGLYVAKHGNRAISSSSGAADILEVFGVKLEQTAKSIEHCLDKAKIAFMLYPIFNPVAMAVKDVRKGLGIRTVFNLLGPLLNPAHPKHMIVGVFSESILDLYSEVLLKLKKRAMVVCSNNVDELTPASIANVRIVDNNEIVKTTVDPEKVGIEKCTLEDLRGKDSSYNAKKLTETLKGEKGAWADTLILNAGCALYISGEEKTIESGIKRAKKVHQEGLGYQKLKEWVIYSKNSKESHDKNTR